MANKYINTCNWETIMTSKKFSLELLAREIQSLKTISGLFVLSKIRDVPGIVFKWLVLKELKG